jgi:hypothetical protein
LPACSVKSSLLPYSDYPSYYELLWLDTNFNPGLPHTLFPQGQLYFFLDVYFSVFSVFPAYARTLPGGAAPGG